MAKLVIAYRCKNCNVIDYYDGNEEDQEALKNNGGVWPPDRLPLGVEHPAGHLCYPTEIPQSYAYFEQFGFAVVDDDWKAE